MLCLNWRAGATTTCAQMRSAGQCLCHTARDRACKHLAGRQSHSSAHLPVRVCEPLMSVLERALSCCSWALRLERAVMEVLKEAPSSVKTPDIGGSGTTASFVKAIKAEL